jgi:hypothetical protein
MVTVAFGIAVSALGGTASGLSLATYAAIAAGGLLTSYIDQQLVYPNLFGKKSTRPDSLEGFQLSTSDPGAPRWTVYGSRAWVPCHILWAQNLRETTTGGSTSGKGARPTVQTVRIDAGLALCDGPIADIDTLYADERPFWSRQFNRVVLEDHRWSITAGAGGEAGQLVILATDADVSDFSGIFAVNDFVRIERMAPLGLNGPYRVTAVTPHSGTAMARLVLQPLRGQTPASGTAGSLFEPALLRRIDQGAASHEWIFEAGSVSGGAGQLWLRRPPNEPTIPGVPNTGEDHLKRKWVPGAIYRIGGLTPSTLDGLYKLVSRLRYNLGFSVGGAANEYILVFEARETTQTGGGVTSFGTATTPTIIVRDQVGTLSGLSGAGFVFLDEAQEFSVYQGTLVQPIDPTLAALNPDPPAHRGLAHISIKDWNLAPHGNLMPRVTGVSRPRSGETVATAIERICSMALPAGHYDASRMRQKALLGYAVPGGMSVGPALQPLLVMYGIIMQDRGGVLTFLDERDVPIVAVATRHLNARPIGERSSGRGFVAQRSDIADIPERVILQYVDPAEGANETEGDGERAPGAATRGKRDTVPINLKPLVAWPHEVKRRAREIRRRQLIESDRGQVRLPPNYKDVLPGHCITFRSNNRNEEDAAASALIAHDCQLRGLLPRSLEIDVRFVGGQIARLRDNGTGALEGFPAGIAALVNTVDYPSGEIQLLCDEALDTDYPPRIAYLYEKRRLMRVRKATLHSHDNCITCDVVSTTTDNPLPPVPRDLPTGLGGAIAAEVSPYRTHVLDIPALYPGGTGSVLMHFAAAPEAGAPWRGAFVYQSPNGVDRWSPVGQIQSPTTIGAVTVNNLPDVAGGASTGYVDWATELEVDLPNGELLEDASSEMIALGANWLLVGNEIVGFHEAENTSGTLWILRGLVRGMRQTFAAMDGHADGERAVLLSNIGALHGLTYEPVGGAASANRTFYFRVVPGGGSIDSVSTIELAFRGNSARSAPPQVDFSMLQQRGGAGGDMRLTWLRRSIEQTTVFGPSPMPPGEIESYRVVAFDGATAAGLIATLGVEGAIAATRKRTWILGDDSMGTPFVHRSVDYTMAELAADWPGHIPGVLPVAFVVYQRGRVGESAASDIVFIVPS